MMPYRFISVLVSVLCAVNVFAALTARLTFDDIGSEGANALHAEVGANAVVKNNPATEVGGIGSCYIVPLDDPAMADESLKYGSRVIAVPQRTYIAVPHGLAAAKNVPFCLVMRSYCPLASNVSVPNYNCLYSFSVNNGGDGFAFVRPGGTVGGGGGGWTHGYQSMGISNDRTEFYNGWHTWILSQSTTGTELYFDGNLVNTGKTMDLTSMPYVYVACDNDGEDWLTYFDYIEIYNESKPSIVFGPAEEIEQEWEGAVTRSPKNVSRTEEASRMLQYVFTDDGTFTPSYAVQGELFCYDAQGVLLETVDDIDIAADGTYAIELGRYTRKVFRCNPPPQLSPKGRAELDEIGAVYAVFSFALETPGDGQSGADLWFGCAAGTTDPAVELAAESLTAGGSWHKTVGGLVPGETYSYLFACSNATDSAFVKRGTFSVPRMILSSETSTTPAKLYRPGMLGGKTVGGHTDTVNVPTMTSGPEAALANSIAPFRAGVPLTVGNSSYAYRANVYLEAGQNLHFAGRFYDWTDVIFNNEMIQWGSGVPGQNYSTIGRSGNLTVTADGWYDLRIRLGTTTGNVGAMWDVVSNNDRTPLSPGFGYNIDGATSQNSADYEYPEDAGDGELLRVETDGSLFTIESLDIADGNLQILLTFAEPLAHDIRVTVCCDDTDHGDRVGNWPVSCILDGGKISAGETRAVISVPHSRNAAGVIRVRVHSDDDIPWAERLVAWSDAIGYSPDVSQPEPSLVVRSAGLSETRDGAKVVYSLYWPGAGQSAADVYAVYGLSPDALTSTNLVAEGAIGPGVLELTGIPSGETVFVAFFARNAAGYESVRSAVSSVFMPTASTMMLPLSGFASRRHVEINTEIAELGAGQYTTLLLTAKKQGEESAAIVASREVSKPGEYTLVWEGSQDNAEWGTNYVFQVVASNYSASAGMAWLRETDTKTLELCDSEEYTWSVAEGNWTDPGSWTPIDPLSDNAGYPIGSYARAVFTNDTKAVVHVAGDQRLRELNLTATGLDLVFTGYGTMRSQLIIVVGGNGCVTFDGVSSNNGGEDFRVTGSSDLIVRDGAVLKASKFHFPVDGRASGTVSVLNGGELRASNYVEVDGGMTLVISNALVKSSGKFWFGDRAAGGRVVLVGETPRLEISNQIQGNNIVSPCEMIFQVPLHGYRNIPVTAGEIDAVNSTYAMIITRSNEGYAGPSVQPLISVSKGIPLDKVPLDTSAWRSAAFLLNPTVDFSEDWIPADKWTSESNPKSIGMKAGRKFILFLL